MNYSPGSVDIVLRGLLIFVMILVKSFYSQQVANLSRNGEEFVLLLDRIHVYTESYTFTRVLEYRFINDHILPK